MIFDSFMYFNEASLLKLRLEELNPYVDCFLVVEADQTFTGHDKPLYFDQVPYEILKPYADKIARVSVSFPRPNMTPWERETYQRNALIQPEMTADDIVVLSDADEIPAPWSIIWYAQDPDNTPKQLDVDQYFWNLNWKVPAHCNQGARPVISYVRDVTTVQAMRADTSMERVPNSGWHFSFFLEDSEGMITKVKSYSHTEMDQAKFLEEEKIKDRITLGIDPFDRFPLKYVPIGETHPKSVRSNPDNYRKWVMNNPWKT